MGLPNAFSVGRGSPGLVDLGISVVYILIGTPSRPPPVLLPDLADPGIDSRVIVSGVSLGQLSQVIPGRQGQATLLIQRVAEAPYPGFRAMTDQETPAVVVTLQVANISRVDA